MSLNPFEPLPDPNDPFTRIRSSRAVAEERLPGSTQPGSVRIASGLGMADFDLDSLERLQREVVAVRERIDSAEADAPPPRRMSASDRTGSFTVIVGADGLPEALQVASGWERKIRPQQFSFVVGEVANAARMAQMNARAEALRQDRSQGQASVTPLDRSGQVPHTAGRESRPLDVLVEDALKLFAEVEQFRPPQPTQGTGQAVGGRLSITIVDGEGISCSADPQWISSQSPATLSKAFRQAASEARTSLAQARASRTPSADNPTAALQGVFGEVMALLQDPNRLTGM